MTAHKDRGSHATIVLHSVPNPLEYGVVVTDDEGNIKRFLEKPSWGEVFSDHANTGIYVIEPKVLDHIKADTNADWSQDVFPTMLRRHEPLHGIVVDDYWTDIGSIQSYLQANWDALDGKVRCHIPGRREGNVWMGEGVEIGIGVQLDGPAFIGDEVKLKAGAILNEHAVIDKYSVIDDNTKISNSIVWPHSYIGERARLRQAIVCRNVTIKNDCLLEENSVVADECVLGKGTQIRAGVKVWPSKSVEPGSTVNELIIWAGEWRQGLFSSYGLGGLDQRRADAGVLRAARRGVRRDAAEGRVRRGRPGPCALVANDQARDRLRHRQRRRQGARCARAAGGGDAVRDARRRLRGGDPRARRRRSISAAPTSASSTREGLQIDKRDERKLENLLFREDFRRAAFYEMGDIEYSEPIAEYTAHLLKSGERRSDPQRRLPGAHRLRLQRCVGGAARDSQSARRDDDSAQCRAARGRAPPHRARRDGARSARRFAPISAA